MVDRYDFGCLDRGYIRENGKWVKYKDYEKLEQENKELLQKSQQLELDVEHFRKVAEDLERVFVTPSLVGGGEDAGARLDRVQLGREAIAVDPREVQVEDHQPHAAAKAPAKLQRFGLALSQQHTIPQ